MTLQNNSIDYKSELLRKSIHLCSLSIPISYNFVSRELMLYVLVPLAIFSLILDVGRRFSPFIFNLLDKFFGFMMRDHEKQKGNFNLSGASWVFISAVVVVLIFPKLFVITGFAVLIVSDLTAALIGRRFGKHKFLFKSLEGTSAFFVSACIVVLLTPKYDGLFLEYIIGFIAVAIGAIAENISYGWADDNLLIPFSIGGAMWIMYSIFLPGYFISL
ncbi:MAG: dolichol kinase [Melioribacteraceae bacterium]|nr:dolichol kinase [Melioribacteraceae bacterium]